METPFEALELRHLYPSSRVRNLVSHKFNNNLKWGRCSYHEGVVEEGSGNKWKEMVEMEEEESGDGRGGGGR